MARSSSVRRWSIENSSNGVWALAGPPSGDQGSGWNGSDEGVDAGLGAADEKVLDLAGVLVEGHHTGVAHVFLDGVLIDVPVAAEGLDRQVGRLTAASQANSLALQASVPNGSPASMSEAVRQVSSRAASAST